MCFLIQSKANAFELSSHYNAKLTSPQLVSTNAHIFGVYNPQYHIITEDAPGILQPFTWGIDLSLMDKNEDTNELTIDVEVIHEMGVECVFRRCVIPVTGFYEMTRNKKKEVCMHLINLDGDIFSLAGVYGEFFDPVNERNLKFFLLLVAPPYAPLPYLCNIQRLPIVLKDPQAWLNEGNLGVIQDLNVEFLDVKKTESLIRAVQTPGADIDPHKKAS